MANELYFALNPDGSNTLLLNNGGVPAPVPLANYCILFDGTNWTVGPTSAAALAALAAPGGSALVGDVSAGVNPQTGTVNSRLNTLAFSGQVSMIRTGTNTWVVLNEYGNPIPTAGTTTSGLQEAINYAKANGLNLTVQGGMSAVTDYGLLYATTTIVFPPMRNARVDFLGVHLESSVTNTDAVTIDSGEQFRFTWVGEIVATSLDANHCCVRIKPTNPMPVDLTVALVSCDFDFVSLVASAGAKAGCVIDPSGGSVGQNKFKFSELNSGAIGLLVLNPGAATFWSQNLVDIVYSHTNSTACVVVGTSNANQANLGNNIYRIGGAASAGNTFESWASGDILQAGTLTTTHAGGANALKYNAGANNNVATIGTIGAGVIADGGSLNSIVHDGKGFFANLQIGPNFAGSYANINNGAAVTITAAQIFGGLLSRQGPVGAFADTTDTAANIVAAIPGCFVGQKITLQIFANTAGAMTLNGGANVTVIGNNVITAGATKIFTFIIDNVTVPACHMVC